MAWRGVILLLGLACVAGADDAEDVARAREKLRAFQADLREAIARSAPAVGAVVHYKVTVEPETGAVLLDPHSLGSGVIVAKDGLFLTNVHVVEGADAIRVFLPDGKRYEAELLADTSGDASTKGDIALLRLLGRAHWPYVDWKKGRTDHLPPGTFVFAMGNPFGHALDGTPVVTLGIISGQGRAASVTGYRYVNAVQTDAEINPGNSGGPLFTMDGELVGINGLMRSRTRFSNSGVGFAIPMDQVRPFMHRLMREDDVGYGYLGVRAIGIADEDALYVQTVDGDSPADFAGLRAGDVILKVNGRKMRTGVEFVNFVGQKPEGARVALIVRQWVRKGNRAKAVVKRFEIKLAAAPAAPREERAQPSRSNGRPPAERGYLGVRWARAGDGLRVTRVLPESEAENAGLQVDDVIVAVQNVAAKNPRRLLEGLAGYEPGRALAVAIRRLGREETVSVRLDPLDRVAEILR